MPFCFQNSLQDWDKYCKCVYKRNKIIPLVNVAVNSVKSILLLFLSICNSNKCFQGENTTS